MSCNKEIDFLRVLIPRRTRFPNPPWGNIEYQVSAGRKPARIEGSSSQNESLMEKEATSSINREKGYSVLYPIPREGA
jgi:hypothetical protein